MNFLLLRDVEKVFAETEIAQKQKDLAVKVAEFKIEQDTKQAEADAAYEIQKEERRAVIEEKLLKPTLLRQKKKSLFVKEYCKQRLKNKPMRKDTKKCKLPMLSYIVDNKRLKLS